MSVKCSDCDYELGEDQSPCPNCGGTRRATYFALDPGVFKLTGMPMQMTVQQIEEEIKKNWPLIAVLSIGDLMSTIPAYFLSGWASVAVTLAFIVFSTIVGYYALTRVVRVTRETH